MLRTMLWSVMVAMALALPAPALAAEHPAPAEHPAAAETHAAPAGTVAEEGHERKHEVIEFDAATAIWVLIIFLVLVVILYKTAWKNVLAGLKAREQKIRQDIADAEASRKKAEETLRQYNQQLASAEQQVRDILTKAAADAEKIATSLKMQAQQEAEEIKERANRDIEAARKAAVADVHAQAAELSTLIASKILRRNLKPEDQADLVKSSLDQFEMVGTAGKA